MLSRPFLSMRVSSRVPQKDSVVNMTVLQQDGGVDKAEAAETSMNGHDKQPINFEHTRYNNESELYGQ